MYGKLCAPPSPRAEDTAEVKAEDTAEVKAGDAAEGPRRPKGGDGTVGDGGRGAGVQQGHPAEQASMPERQRPGSEAALPNAYADHLKTVIV